MLWGRKREPGDNCVAHALNVYEELSRIYRILFTHHDDLRCHTRFLTSLAIREYQATKDRVAREESFQFSAKRVLLIAMATKDV